MTRTGSPDHADRTTDVAMDRGNPARTGEMPGPGPVGAPIGRWRFEVGEDIVSPAIVVNGVVYVAGTFEPLCAIDAASGQEQWRFNGSGPIRGVPSTADFNGRAPSYADGLIVACGISTAKDHALVYAVDAASGQERWRSQIDEQFLTASPMVSDSIVYLSGYSGWLYAITGTDTPAPGDQPC